MGGVMIILATICGYFAGAVWMFLKFERVPKVSSLLVLLVMCLMGLLGFIDDFKKVSAKKNDGLMARFKIIGQIIVGTLFAIACFSFPSEIGRTPGSFSFSFLRDFIPFSLQKRLVQFLQ